MLYPLKNFIQAFITSALICTFVRRRQRQVSSLRAFFIAHGFQVMLKYFIITNGTLKNGNDYNAKMQLRM